jgi:hypothetical protein
MARFSFSVCQPRVSWSGAPSMARWWGSNLLLILLLGPSPAELTTVFYYLIWDSRNLEAQVLVFTSRINRVANLYPLALGSLFVASYDSQGYGGDILIRLHRLIYCRYQPYRSICLMSMSHKNNNMYIPDIIQSPMPQVHNKTIRSLYYRALCLVSHNNKNM